MSSIRVAALDRRMLRLVQLTVLVAVIVAGVIAPSLFFVSKASAAQITSRSLTISTSRASATSVTYLYGFTTATAGMIQSLKFEACTTPLGTCTPPTGLDIDQGTTGTWSGTEATNFARDGTGGGSCTPADNVLCGDRTDTDSESVGAKTISWGTQTNPSVTGSFFVRITTYSDAGWTTAVDNGVVAAAIVNQLTVNARIQEILNFCVGTTTVNDATTSPGADCSAITGTTVDIGVLDSSAVNVSPVSTNGGSNTNGIAMVRTNAQNGVVISYFSEQNSSSGTLKVTGASCSGTSTTDQCINSDANQATFSAGTEAFGMTIAGTNCGSTSSYTCVYASGSNNLEPTGEYIGAGSNTYGVSNGYAWNGSTTPEQIASSAGSSIKVVDDEAIILRFAATPAITTPTGAYTVTSTYIATATY